MSKKTIQPPVKCLSICQPWASMVAYGFKCPENRTWATKHRGPIAIHASTSPRHMTEENDDFLMDLHPIIERTINPPGVEPDSDEAAAIFPMGAIVGVADLYDCVAFDPTADDPDDLFPFDRYPPGSIDEMPHGVWTEGPFCFMFRDAIKFARSIPCKGKLNIWHLDEALQEAVADAIEQALAAAARKQQPVPAAAAS